MGKENSDLSPDRKKQKTDEDEAYREMVQSTNRLNNLVKSLKGSFLKKSDLMEPPKSPIDTSIFQIPQTEDSEDEDFVSLDCLRVVTFDTSITESDLINFFTSKKYKVNCYQYEQTEHKVVTKMAVSAYMQFRSNESLKRAILWNGEKIGNDYIYLSRVRGRFDFFYKGGLDKDLGEDVLKLQLQKNFEACDLQNIILAKDIYNHQLLGFGYLVTTQGVGKSPIEVDSSVVYCNPNRGRFKSEMQCPNTQIRAEYY